MTAAWITEPGIYVMSAADYHRDPVVGGSLSSTGAKRLLPPSCPAKFLHEREHGRPEKREFDFGHAAHTEVLGRGEEFVVIDAGDYNTKAARAARDAAYAAHKAPVLTHEYEAVQQMAAKLREHDDAWPLLDPTVGRAETVLVWRDEETGVMCRCMIDFLHDAWPGQTVKAVDYKTSRAVDPESVRKAVADWGYVQQAPFYLDGVTGCDLDGGLDPEFWFIFQEKTAPYLITVGKLDDQALAVGRVRNRKARDVYRRCTESDEWPAYVTAPIEISLPGWELKRFNDAWFDGAYDIHDIGQEATA